MIKAYTRKTKYGYKGYVACFNDKKRLWSECAGIERICREHAQEDAENRKKDREYTG